MQHKVQVVAQKEAHRWQLAAGWVERLQAGVQAAKVLVAWPGIGWGLAQVLAGETQQARA